MSSRTLKQGGPAAPERATNRTVVGVDVGIRNLFTMGLAGDADLSSTVVVDGEYERALLEELAAVTRRFRLMPGNTTAMEENTRERYERALLDRYDEAVDTLEAYVLATDADVVAIEELPGDPPTLERVLTTPCGLDEWAMHTLQERARRQLEPHTSVVPVDPHATTCNCHVCGERGHHDERDRVLCCETYDCPVREVDQDRSAAVSIAQRVT
ncbi:hypothetical protein CP556_25135 [Natrinema sp. CBA1119]|uniref:hypothetical protein n=1 Tax=Natrinema sp. CBA1119 TaxID=1608465 RepID=UPI000BF9A68B|nr:hypothetical protein [Natrinema sp. CBA1119]PGF13815.1 hypothetical protein CP556_25135 [Natrinema sp. CBA1119]